MKRVVSIRIEPSTLAGVYDFLEHICSYDTSRLPVSTATQVAMEAIVEWFRRKGELPLYETDESALARIGKGGNYIPGACLPEAVERIAPVPMRRGKRSSKSHRNHTPTKVYSPYVIEDVVEQARVINQNLTNNSTEPAMRTDPNVLKSKQEHMISLIDQFMAREEDADLRNMIEVVKETKLYKDETYEEAKE